LELGLNGSIGLFGFRCIYHDPVAVYIQYLHAKRLAGREINIVIGCTKGDDLGAVVPGIERGQLDLLPLEGGRSSGRSRAAPTSMGTLTLELSRVTTKRRPKTVV